MRKKLVIKIMEDLPPRARQLNPDELSAVFGGCIANGYPCILESDCCSGDCYGVLTGVCVS